MPLLSAAQIASMAASLTGTLLSDSAQNSRTGTVTPCHLVPDGTTELGGDGRIAPLTRHRVTLSAGTDVRAGDILSVQAQGRFFVTSLDVPVTHTVCAQAYAIQLYDVGSGSFGAGFFPSVGTGAVVEGLSTTLVDVHRGATTVITGVLTHVEPINPKPFEEMQAPDQSQGQTIFDHYLLFPLVTSTVDIRPRDQLLDQGEVDPLTGTAARYYVRRVKKWAGPHLELECDRIASAPQT